MKLAYMWIAMVTGALVSGCAAQPAEGKFIPLTKKSELEATYISGDLGSYWDCPQQSTGKADSAGPSAGMEQCSGDDPDCNDFMRMNCYDASLALRITNVGPIEASKLVVTDIEVLTPEGELIASGSLKKLTQLDGHEFNGVVEMGGYIDLHVEFQGVELQWDEKAKVRIIFATGDDTTVELTSPELQGASIIVT